MSQTPLSDLISCYLDNGSKADFDAMLEEFCGAEVGLWVPGLAPGARVNAAGLRVPLFQVPNGIVVIRVCADPVVFARRFDPRLNAWLTGREVLEMLMKMDAPEIAGVLLASAASEHSVLIARGDVPEILDTALSKG